MDQEKIILTNGQVTAIQAEMEKLKNEIQEIQKHFGNSKLGGPDHNISANQNLTEQIYTLNARLSYWKEILRNSTTNIVKKDSDIVQIGSIVNLHEVYENTDITIQVLGTVVGIEDAQYEIVTANSNFGKVLLGKERRVGDEIPFLFDIENPCKYRIMSIQYNDQLYKEEIENKQVKTKTKRR